MLISYLNYIYSEQTFTFRKRKEANVTFTFDYKTFDFLYAVLEEILRVEKKDTRT
jgi:hypothetical protein